MALVGRQSTLWDKESALSAPKGATPKDQIPEAHGHGVPRAE